MIMITKQKQKPNKMNGKTIIFYSPEHGKLTAKISWFGRSITITHATRPLKIKYKYSQKVIRETVLLAFAQTENLLDKITKTTTQQ